MRANTPMVSNGLDNASTPLREIAPKLGLNPYTPQNAAGRMTEPLVWLPVARGTMPAAIAAAEPLEDPPGVRPGSCGLVVSLGA